MFSICTVFLFSNKATYNSICTWSEQCILCDTEGYSPEWRKFDSFDMKKFFIDYYLKRFMWHCVRQVFILWLIHHLRGQLVKSLPNSILVPSFINDDNLRWFEYNSNYHRYFLKNICTAANIFGYLPSVNMQVCNYYVFLHTYLENISFLNEREQVFLRFVLNQTILLKWG